MHTFSQHAKISFWRGDDYIIPSMHCFWAPAVISASLLLLIHYNSYSSSWKLPTRYILQQRPFYIIFSLRINRKCTICYLIKLHKLSAIVFHSSSVPTWSPLFCPQKSDSHVEENSSNTCASAAASAKWRTAFTIGENVADDHQSHRTAVRTNERSVWVCCLKYWLFKKHPACFDFSTRRTENSCYSCYFGIFLNEGERSCRRLYLFQYLQDLPF